MTIAEKLVYYQDRMILQYRDQPNARGQIAIMGKQVMSDDLATDLRYAFCLDTAVGAQLDILGKYLGVPRNIGIVQIRSYFGLWASASTFLQADYQGTWAPASNTPAISGTGTSGYWYVASASGTASSPVVASFVAGDIIHSNGSVWAKATTDNGNGLTSYASPAINQNGIFYSYDYASGQNDALTDAQYRVVLKLKAVLNLNDGTLASIEAYLDEFFPDQIWLVDSKDMALAYTVLSTVALSQELLAIYLPRPMGVGITVTIISPTPGGQETITTEAGEAITTEDAFTIKTETT